MDELPEKIEKDKTFSVKMTDDERDRKYAGWLKAIEKAKNWVSE
jgi:glycerol kinase